MLKKLALFSLVAFGFIACEPSEAGHTELGALPQADYSLTYIDSNTVQLVSNSSGDPFLFNWDIEGVGTYTGESVEVFIGTMGTYDVTHTVFNQGGSASANGQIEILKDGPMYWRHGVVNGMFKQNVESCTTGGLTMGRSRRQYNVVGNPGNGTNRSSMSVQR
jgi:PKD repeat protein